MLAFIFFNNLWCLETDPLQVQYKYNNEDGYHTTNKFQIKSRHN